jgi:hypothetical protein
LVLLLLEKHLLLLELFKGKRGGRRSSVCDLGGERRLLPLSARGRGRTSWLWGLLLLG